MTRARLSLSAFEHLMLAQDSPAYPCVIFIRFDFSGALDHGLFDRCLREMLDRHPLLRARVQRRWNGIHWVFESSSRVSVHWLSTPPSEEWVADSRLDLFQEVGTRVIVHSLAESCTIIFQVHHACVDGKGILAAFDDLWKFYDARSRGQRPALPCYDANLLPRRNHFGLNIRSAMDTIPKQRVGLIGIRQYLMRHPVPIVPHEAIPPDNAVPLPVSCQIARFEESEVRCLRDTATRNAVTLNELLTTSVFQGIASFREKKGLGMKDEWIRMMVPVNMRSTEQDSRQTACNIVSSIFLDRTPAQIEDRGRLLVGIHQEMEIIKRNRLGLMFIASIWVKKWLPTKRSQSLAPARCQTTVVVTNVGRLFHDSPLATPQGKLNTGDLTLESITMLAPMTPFLSAAFTITEYANELFVVVRFDSRILEAEDARDLLHEVAESLRNPIWLAPTAHEA